MTTREQALSTLQQSLLPQIGSLYAIEPHRQQLYPDYEGCRNLVFFWGLEAAEYVLRVSYRDDRTPDQIHAEIDFIRFLYEHGVRVSPPIKCAEDDIPFLGFFESIYSPEHPFQLAPNERQE